MTALSRTVMPLKIVVSWKVLTMPLRAAMCGESPEMRSPRSRTSPELGARNDEISLKSVDLPAPLGPMIETISPSATSKDTSLTATRPPKRLVRCDTRRRPVTVSSPLLRQQPQAQEPVGQDQHQRDQDAGIDEELVLARAKEEVPAE